MAAELQETTFAHGVESALAALDRDGAVIVHDFLAPPLLERFHDDMREVARHRHLGSVDPNPATIASGQTPIVIDWTYNNAAQADPLSKKGVTWKTVIPTDAAPVAAYYNSAINKDAPHPAAARCWMEYVFSDAGQNAWLKGFAIPIRLSAMQKAGTLDQAAFTALNPPTTTPVMLTADQITAAKKALTTSWTFITIK